MTTTQYVVFLVIAVALTLGVGQLLFKNGQPFLEDVFQSTATARSANLLLTVLFHLITLGVLALSSTINVPAADGVRAIVLKLGIVLVIVGIAYGLSMLVLLRIRERRRAAGVSANVRERMTDQYGRPLGNPVPPPA